MEKAMKQAKIAEKDARRASKEELRARRNVQVAGDESGEGRAGITVIRNTVTHPGTFIHVESAENIQIGSNNTMHIHKDKKGKTSSRQDSSSDSDDGCSNPPARRTPSVPLQDKDPSSLTEAEKRLLEVLKSEREVTPADMIVCSQHVGNWRRFLRYLGLNEALIEQLHMDYHAEGVRQIIYQGVIEWTRKEGREATIGALAKILQKVEVTEAIYQLQP